MTLPVLGVGVTYFSGLDQLLSAHPELVDVLEVEPQTLWYRTRSAERPFAVDEEALERLAALPCRKLLHGIGFPVGGGLPPDLAQREPLLRMIERLEPPWISEHLSFNRAFGPHGEFLTGFLLPPCQSPEGVLAAVASIRAMQAMVPLPLAVETGVSYLNPRPWEMPDGAFVAAVADQADCGLILDLHNLWTNERNGRQGVVEFLDQLPLERVWEVHLAGGSERGGYWLDSHAGAVPDTLLDLASTVVPRLPSLRAIVFELFPAYVDAVGLDVVERQLAALRGLWEARVSAQARSAPASWRGAGQGEWDTGPAVREWEDTLGALTIGLPVDSPLGRMLSRDPGIAIIRELVGEFRASMIVSALRLTSRLLMLGLGADGFQDLLRGYWRQAPPALFASDEAEGFGRYLERHAPPVAHLLEVLAFERATIATLLDGEPRTVRFSHDPVPLLRALAEGTMPEEGTAGDFEIVLTGNRGQADVEALRPAVANH